MGQCSRDGFHKLVVPRSLLSSYIPLSVDLADEHDANAALYLDHGKKRLKVEPDASLAFESNNPFLVLKVAVTPNAKPMKKKT